VTLAGVTLGLVVLRRIVMTRDMVPPPAVRTTWAGNRCAFSHRWQPPWDCDPRTSRQCACDACGAVVRLMLPEFVDANTATGQFVVERDRYIDR
jgi:hypothetical protein